MKYVVLFSLFSLFFITDILFDVSDGVPAGHVWHEILLFVLSIGALVSQLIEIIRQKKDLQKVRNELNETTQAYVQWQNKSRTNAAEIRKLIDEQFDHWALSAGEKDVALLLIKGLAMKEIADIRQTQEKTVRQQATSIYKKSGLSGRQELAAFFLEDILSTPV